MGTSLRLRGRQRSAASEEGAHCAHTSESADTAVPEGQLAGGPRGFASGADGGQRPLRWPYRHARLSQNMLLTPLCGPGYVSTEM